MPGPSLTLSKEYRRSGIRIGDVGIIYRSGRFDFLFNIFLSANHDINRGRVPEGFSPLKFALIKNDIDTALPFGPGSYLASTSLRKTSNNNASYVLASTNIRKSGNSFVARDFIFETSDNKGAVLMMPDGALSQDLLNRKSLNKYIAKNAKQWYEYTTNTRGREIDNGDIRVVVGVDKVSSWGIATFASNAEERVRLEFKGTDDRAVTKTYMWNCAGACGRVGPLEEEMRGLSQETDENLLRNQSVFVRTLNFSLSGRTWEELAIHQVLSSNLRDGPSASHWAPSDKASSGHGRSATSGGSVLGQGNVNFSPTQLKLCVSRI